MLKVEISVKEVWLERQADIMNIFLKVTNLSSKFLYKMPQEEITGWDDGSDCLFTLGSQLPLWNLEQSLSHLQPLYCLNIQRPLKALSNPIHSSKPRCSKVSLQEKINLPTLQGLHSLLSYFVLSCHQPESSLLRIF